MGGHQYTEGKYQEKLRKLEEVGTGSSLEPSEGAWPYQQPDSRLWASGRVKEFTDGGGCFVFLTQKSHIA